MKKLLMIIVLALALQCLTAAEEWVQPAYMAKNDILYSFNGSLVLPNGVVNVVHTRDGMFAQYLGFNGVKQWGEKGVKLLNENPMNSPYNDCRIIQSDSHSVIIAVLLYQFNIVKVQKLSLNGDLLWEAPLILYGYGSKITYFKPDNRGGAYISSYKNIDFIKHISSAGELTTPFPDDSSYSYDFHVSGDGTFYILKSGSLTKYAHNAEVLWTRQISMQFPMYINELDLGHIVVTGRDFTHYKANKFSQEGQNLWNIDGIELLTAYNTNLNSVKTSGNNLILMYHKDSQILLQNISVTGNPVWPQPISFGNIYNPYCCSEISITPDHYINVVWQEKKYIGSSFYYIKLLFQRISDDGTFYWDTPKLLSEDWTHNFEKALPLTFYKNNHVYYLELTNDHQYSILYQKNEFEPQNKQIKHEIFKAQMMELRNEFHQWNGQNTFMIWKNISDNQYEIYYQLINQEGILLLEEGGRPLYKGQNGQLIHGTFKDQEGHYYIVWSEDPNHYLNQYAYFSDDEVPNRNIDQNTYIQKINGFNGRPMYPDKGIILHQGIISPQIMTQGNTHYFYYDKENHIYSQKMTNDELQWDISGKLIFDNVFNEIFYYELPCPEENLLIKKSLFDSKTLFKLYLFDHDSNPAENWPQNGVEIFRYERNNWSNVKVFHVQNSYLCILYDEENIQYTVLDENGNIIQNKQTLIDITDKYVAHILFDERLYIIGNYSNQIVKWVFEYQNNELIPRFDTFQTIDHPYFRYIEEALPMQDKFFVTKALRNDYYQLLHDSYMIFDENGIATGEPTPLFTNTNPHGETAFKIKINNESLYAVFQSNYNYYLQKISIYPFTNHNDECLSLNQISLSQNYPNPFNPSTKICYTLKNAGATELSIFNIKGQKVATLVNEVKTAGTHEITWNGIDEQNKKVSSGIYFYRLQSGTSSITKKMILMK